MVRAHWFWGNSFWPPTLEVGEKEVALKRYKFLCFMPQRDAIPFHRIAAVSLNRGIMTSHITVETSGGGKHKIAAVPHREAEQVVATIREKIDKAVG